MQNFYPQPIRENIKMNAMEAIRKAAVALSVLGAFGLVSSEAGANVSSAAATSFKTVFTSQFNQWTLIPGTGAYQNTGSSMLQVVAQVAYPSSNPLTASVKISNLSSCLAQTVGATGTILWSSSPTFGQSSGLTWQNLSLGTPTTPAAAAVVVYCNLEPNAEIAIVSQ
jgi:hypothetical protein